VKDPVVVFVDRTFLLWVALSLLASFARGAGGALLWVGLDVFVHDVTCR
jgi:hypothetical protein